MNIYIYIYIYVYIYTGMVVFHLLWFIISIAFQPIVSSKMVLKWWLEGDSWAIKCLFGNKWYYIYIYIYTHRAYTYYWLVLFDSAWVYGVDTFRVVFELLKRLLICVVLFLELPFLGHAPMENCPKIVKTTRKRHKTLAEFQGKIGSCWMVACWTCFKWKIRPKSKIVTRMSNWFLKASSRDLQMQPAQRSFSMWFNWAPTRGCNFPLKNGTNKNRQTKDTHCLEPK